MELNDLEWRADDDKCSEIDLEDEDADVMISQKKVSPCKSFYLWFCGYDDTNESTQSGDPIRTGLKSSNDTFEAKPNLNILRQTRAQKIFLRSILILTVILAIFLFTYFSLPFHRYSY